MSKLRYFTFSIFLLFIFSGCSTKNTTKNYSSDNLTYKVNSHIIYDNLNSAINSLSNQIFLNITKDVTTIKNKIAISTFINNDNFKSTSTLGRLISENLVNDLHIKGFKVIDLATKQDISINNNGIFYLTREQIQLKEKKSEIYILVGTYSKSDYDSIVINARLLNYDTSEVISTGKVIYTMKDCSIVDLCNDTKIRIIKD